MNQTERRLFLIRELLQENPQYHHMEIPTDLKGQKKLLRALMNVRLPKPINQNFLVVQNAYLQEELTHKGVTDIKELKPIQKGIYLWQGDITTLKVNAIVNAANSGMTGCYCPGHGCIDNAIHTYAGVQLRLACADLMQQQAHEEETGTAKITSAYNLPCQYILHTVGPIVHGRLTEKEKRQLASCYHSCLALAEQNQIKSIAFCCISTGEFHFPNDIAAGIAVQTVQEYLEQTQSRMEVIFNVFKDTDYEIYRQLLNTDTTVKS